MAEVRRPHLSASMNAGRETSSIVIEETPEATRDELLAVIPAWVKSAGAYYSQLKWLENGNARGSVYIGVRTYVMASMPDS